MVPFLEEAKEKIHLSKEEYNGFRLIFVFRSDAGGGGPNNDVMVQFHLL